MRTATDLFQTGDWFFKLDYTSGHQHVEIFPEHTRFLGCPLGNNFYKFTVLPFGLVTGPFIFTKDPEGTC